MQNELNDLTLTRRAVRGRWPVPQAVKEKSVKLVEGILDSPADLELKLAAVNTALVMDRVNLKEEEIHTPRMLHISKTPTAELLDSLKGLIGEQACKQIQAKLLPTGSGPTAESSINPSAFATDTD